MQLKQIATSALKTIQKTPNPLTIQVNPLQRQQNALFTNLSRAVYLGAFREALWRIQLWE
jgi:hypothetical protein